MIRSLVEMVGSVEVISATYSREHTHSCFETLEAHLIFERDGKTMQRAHGLAFLLKVCITLCSTGERTLHEYFS